MCCQRQCISDHTRNNICKVEWLHINTKGKKKEGNKGESLTTLVCINQNVYHLFCQGNIYR